MQKVHGRVRLWQAEIMTRDSITGDFTAAGGNRDRHRPRRRHGWLGSIWKPDPLDKFRVLGISMGNRWIICFSKISIRYPTDVPRSKSKIWDIPLPNRSWVGYPVSILYDFKANNYTWDISVQTKKAEACKIGYRVSLSKPISVGYLHPQVAPVNNRY